MVDTNWWTRLAWAIRCWWQFETTWLSRVADWTWPERYKNIAKVTSYKAFWDNGRLLDSPGISYRGPNLAASDPSESSMRKSEIPSQRDKLTQIFFNRWALASEKLSINWFIFVVLLHESIRLSFPPRPDVWWNISLIVPKNKRNIGKAECEEWRLMTAGTSATRDSASGQALWMNSNKTSPSEISPFVSEWIHKRNSCGREEIKRSENKRTQSEAEENRNLEKKKSKERRKGQSTGVWVWSLWCIKFFHNRTEWWCK